MLVFDKKDALSHHLDTLRQPKTTLGFVPTMGALHQGHLSLLAQSVDENDITVISIFVNPTQFNNPEDLEKYPRTLESDIQKVGTISPDILIYAPTVSDIYNGKTESKSYSFEGLEHQMEGKYRPGHFDGVGTVVKKLFEIVTPTKAYFGEKDFQQLQIVKKLVTKEQLPVDIVGCPVFREANGLAMSSRNERLSTTERKEAAIIYATLQKTARQFSKQSIAKTRQMVVDIFAKTPLFQLEYFEIAEETTLKPALRKQKNRKYRAFIAVFANNVRLIDTISLN
ncbi:pantoate--beta-alanine ligase [Flavobacterium sp.]|uniref:pantoate--beta-alanine ligase n=1 Tax=Flavobacterium sp. TaxID=239 RepID=UPI00262C6AE1|nr:pantoate--beta-alanine ligase [Flavobacterium sp.]